MRNNDRTYHDCGHSFHTEPGYDESLAGLLDRCGRYFAHRIGGSRRGQSSVLAFLADHPNATQKELSEGLGIMPASLSEVLMKMERKGLVTRIKDENDRRFVRVRLTDEGEQLLSEPAADPADPFTALSPEEQETLKGILEKLLADWETRDDINRACRSHRPFEPHEGEHRDSGRKHPGHGGDHHGGRHNHDRR